MNFYNLNLKLQDKINRQVICTLLYDKDSKQFWNLFIAVYKFQRLVKKEFRFQLV